MQLQIAAPWRIERKRFRFVANDFAYLLLLLLLFLIYYPQNAELQML